MIERTPNWLLRVGQVSNAAISVLLVMLTVNVLIEVGARALLPSVPSWTEELARVLVVWLAFLSISGTLIHGDHMGFEFLHRYLPHPIVRVLRVAIWLWVIGFLLVVTYSSIPVVWTARQGTSPALRIPQAWAYASVPVGCTLALITSVVLLTRESRKER